MLTRKLCRLLANYAAAVEGLAFLGSSDPEDHDEIRQRYRKTRAALVKRLETLEASHKDLMRLRYPAQE